MGDCTHYGFMDITQQKTFLTGGLLIMETFGKGKLIVIEGLDGTGKATQTQMAIDYLVKERGMVYGEDVIHTDFPRYGKPSSNMVEHYLSGKFGNNPDAINPYTVSSFYAIDRAISYNTEKWGEVYRNGGIVILDRYVTANIIYQGAKLLKDNQYNGLIFRNDLKEFIEWLTKYEYTYNQIPCPDAVLFLMMNKTSNEKLLTDRGETAIDGDIHEKNTTYLDKCRLTLDQYKNILEHDYILGNQSRNFFINTNDDNLNVKSKEDIHSEIVKCMSSIIDPEPIIEISEPVRR